jgi:hypothetical protein
MWEYCSPRSAWAKSTRPYLKNKREKAGGMAQVEEHLPSRRSSVQTSVPSKE